MMADDDDSSDAETEENSLRQIEVHKGKYYQKEMKCNFKGMGVKYWQELEWSEWWVSFTIKYIIKAKESR